MADPVTHLASIMIQVPMTLPSRADTQAAKDAALSLLEGAKLPDGAYVASVAVSRVSSDDQGAAIDGAAIGDLENAALRDLGGDDAVARWIGGDLTEEQLTRHVRDRLLGQLDELAERRPKMRFWSIPHNPVCWAKGLHPSARDAKVTWSTAESLQDWSPAEELGVLRINKACATLRRHPWLSSGGGSVTTKVRWHKGVCAACGQQATQTSVLVSVRWAGRELSREYLLGAGTGG